MVEALKNFYGILRSMKKKFDYSKIPKPGTLLRVIKQWNEAYLKPPSTEILLKFEKNNYLTTLGSDGKTYRHQMDASIDDFFAYFEVISE